MKKNFLSSIILIILILTIHADMQHNKIYAQSNNIQIDNISLPSVNSKTMNNGLRLLHIKDELPRTIIILSTGFGKLYENNTNAGISDLIAKTLSLAGSKKYPAEVLHSTIENIGGRFAVESSFEETIIMIEVLEKYTTLAFDILKDIVENPNIDTNIFENAKSLIIESVRRKKDDPATLGFEKAREIIFNSSGYGSSATEKSLKSISKSDALKVLENYFTANNLIAGISSSLDYQNTLNETKVFDTLKAGKRIDYNVDVKAISDTLAEKSAKIFLIPKDIPQATIVVGTVAPNISDEKIYSLSLMNDILGGGSFNSRLMHEIRVKRGLAYAVQSIIKFRKNTGVFLAYAQTRSESVDSTLSLMLDNIKKMSDSQVKDDELKLAKNLIKNSYIFEFDTTINILKKYSFLSYNGLPVTFLLDYVKKIENIQKDVIQKNAGKLFTNGLVKIIVGNKDLEKKLSKFGSVIVLDK